MSNSGDSLIRFYVRTTRALRSVFKGLVSELGGTRTFSRRRYLLSQEVVMNAVWLMLKDMDVNELAARLAPYVDAVDLVFATDQEAADEVSGPGTIAHDPGPARGKTRKKA